jgi:Arc/MetJ-type ribon-helix-helix transcriptional regulator
MTMLSFRVEDGDAAHLQEWSARLGMDRSEVLRDALRRHLNRLAAEGEASKWEATPLDEDEQALATIADWGPAERWYDWIDAAR